MRSGAFIAALVGCGLVASAMPASAEGLIPTPLGWRPAPCCRENGFPGYRGRPPLEFLYGAIAPALAASLARPPIAVPPGNIRRHRQRMGTRRCRTRHASSRGRCSGNRPWQGARCRSEPEIPSV